MTGERTCLRQRCGALRSGGNIEEVREKQNLRKRIDREGKERQKWAKVPKAGIDMIILIQGTHFRQKQG